ncbi:hypothetical protein [Actinomadura chokoriensis]|uniref:Uncharacterized protein n=1 Tax=Actinomadura chokoriensis TaxID=454156 RepID=A0ABV4RCK4_9ACTN
MGDQRQPADLFAAAAAQWMLSVALWKAQVVTETSLLAADADSDRDAADEVTGAALEVTAFFLLESIGMGAVTFLVTEFAAALDEWLDELVIPEAVSSVTREPTTLDRGVIEGPATPTKDRQVAGTEPEMEMVLDGDADSSAVDEAESYGGRRARRSAEPLENVDSRDVDPATAETAGSERGSAAVLGDLLSTDESPFSPATCEEPAAKATSGLRPPACALTVTR